MCITYQYIRVREIKEPPRQARPTCSQKDGLPARAGTMVLCKPHGVRLSVWRALLPEDRVLVLRCETAEECAAVVDRLTCSYSLPSPKQPLDHYATTPRGRSRTRRRLPGSTSISLGGSLEGWTKEKRRTASGRKYLGIPRLLRVHRAAPVSLAST